MFLGVQPNPLVDTVPRVLVLRETKSPLVLGVGSLLHGERTSDSVGHVTGIPLGPQSDHLVDTRIHGVD